jgi:hypothetical protein
MQTVKQYIVKYLHANAVKTSSSPNNAAAQLIIDVQSMHNAIAQLCANAQNNAAQFKLQCELYACIAKAQTMLQRKRNSDKFNTNKIAKIIAKKQRKIN